MSEYREDRTQLVLFSGSNGLHFLHMGKSNKYEAKLEFECFDHCGGPANGTFEDIESWQNSVAKVIL